MVSRRLGAPLLGLVLLVAVTAAGVIPRKETCVRGPDGATACGEVAGRTTLEDVEADTAGAGNTDRGERAIIGTRVCINSENNNLVCGPVIESAVAMDFEPSTRSGPLPAYLPAVPPKPVYPPPPPPPPVSSYVPPPPVVPAYTPPTPPVPPPPGYKPVPAPPPASPPTYHPPPPPPPPPVVPPPPPVVPPGGVYPPPPPNYKPLIPPQTYPQTPLREIRVDVLYRKDDQGGSPADDTQAGANPAGPNNRIDETASYSAPAQPSSRDESQTRVDPLTALLPTVNGLGSPLKVPIPVTLKCDLSAVEPLPGFTLPSGALPSVDLNAILAPFNPLAKPKPDTPPPKPPTPPPPYPPPARTGGRSSQDLHVFDLAADDMRNRQIRVNLDHTGVAEQRERESKMANLRERLNARNVENERMMSEIGNGLYEKRQLEQELHEMQRLGSHSGGYTGGYAGQSSHATVTQGSGTTIHSQNLGTIDLNTPSARGASETGRSSSSARFAPYGSYGGESQMTSIVSSSGGSSMGMPGMHMHRPFPMGGGMMGGMMGPMGMGGMMYRNADGQQVPTGATTPTGANAPAVSNPPTGTPLTPTVETKNQKTTPASTKVETTSAEEDSSVSRDLFKTEDESSERKNSAEDDSLESSYDKREKERVEREKKEREEKENEERERKKAEDDRQRRIENGDTHRGGKGPSDNSRKTPKRSKPKTEERKSEAKNASDEYSSW